MQGDSECKDDIF